MKLHFKTGLKRCPECKSKIKMVNEGTEMMFNDSFPDTPYNDKMMDKAGAIRNSIIGK